MQVNGSLELLNGVRWDVGVGCNANFSLGGIILAGSGNSSSRGVWVFTLCLLQSGLEVLEGVGLPTTIASEGSGIAGDNLLLGEANKLFCLDEVSSLDSAGGRESPA